MAFVVSGISAYTDQLSQELVKQLIMTGRTMQKATIIPGVKYKTALNEVANTVTINAASCGWAPTGSVAFSQRELTATALEVKDALCPKTLEQYWMGQMMKPGTAQEVDLGQVLAASYIDKIKEQNELNMWQGNASASAYTKFDGFLKILSGSGTVATGALNTGHTVANIMGSVASMSYYVPDDIKDREDLTLFMSYANFDLYSSALIAANLYNYSGDAGTAHEVKIPGKNILVSATKGLSGSGKMVLTYNANLVVGTDLLNEEEIFNIWYSKDNDEVRVNIQWKLGVQVYFPTHAVINYTA